MTLNDTVFAPATAPVNAPVAIIRISGPGSLGAAEKIFSSPEALKPRMAVHGSITFKQKTLDDVILVYYKAPSSYTGEDMAEIFCHGNMIIVRRIMEILSELGLRMAGPGEFTKRAFLNGKMDLTEAEAVNRIITATGSWEISAALDQMHGSVHRLTEKMRQAGIQLKADIEAEIDFSDQAISFISPDQAAGQCEGIKKDLSDMLLHCTLGKKMSEGLKVSIAGRPNAGKSSLLNLLLNRERAIVSDIPGTTRDIISENIQLGGIRLRISDTAGIRKPADAVEEIGISLSRKNIQEAAVVLLVLDGTSIPAQEDLDLLKETEGRQRILLINKCDMADESRISAWEKYAEGEKTLRFSARTGQGLEILEAQLKEFIFAGDTDLQECFVAEERVTDLLAKAMESISRAEELIRQHEPQEIIAFELDSFLSFLGEITGEISPDNVLDSVFSRFCIGK